MNKNRFNDDAARRDRKHQFIGALILFAIFLVCVGMGLKAIDRVAAQQERIHGRR